MLLANNLDFKLVESPTFINLLRLLNPDYQNPSPEDLLNNWLEKRSLQLTKDNCSLDYKNLIYVVTNATDQYLISLSYAETFNDTKVFLKLEKFMYTIIRGDDFSDEVDYDELKKRLIHFCIDSAVEMLIQYDKKISYVLYKVKDIFLPFHPNKMLEINGERITIQIHAVPCMGNVTYYLKKKDFIINSEEGLEQQAQYYKKLNQFEEELKTLKLHEAVEKFFMLIEDNQFKITDFSDDNIFNYINSIALGSNFLNPNFNGHFFSKIDKFYDTMISELSEMIPRETIDLLGLYVGDDELFVTHCDESFSPEKYWQILGLRLNQNQKLKKLSDFAKDLLEIPAVVTANVDFDECIKCLNNKLADRYMHVLMNYLMNK